MNLNFFTISLPFEEFQIQTKQYSDEDFSNLKDSYNKDASFFRYGDHTFISPRPGFDKELGELVTIRVNNHPEIVRSLIRHILFRVFKDDDYTKGMVPESFCPLRFHSTKSDHDPIRKQLPSEISEYIQYPRLNEIHVKSISPDGIHSFGLLVKSRHNWRLNRTLDLILQDGLELAGKTVVEKIPRSGLEGILADDEVVLGRINSIDGEKALISTNEGEIETDLNNLFLQKTSPQIKEYLELKVGSKKTGYIFDTIKKFHFNADASTEFTEIFKLIGWFSKKEYRNNDGFCFKVVTNTAFQSEGIKLERTSLVFDLSPGSSKNWVAPGLKDFGPFDSARYANKSFKILVIAHQRQHGAVTSFIGKLVNGMPDSKYFQQGFQDLFRLQNVDVVYKTITANFPENYENAIDEAIKENTGNPFCIAMVECPDGSRYAPLEHNPYYRAKSRLMTHGIPVQCITEEHLRKSADSLSFTLGPVGLQIYAKTGGIPWILPSSQSTDAELIIGIGNSIYRPNYWSGVEQSRVVGITTFFNGDGRYLMGQESRTVPYDDYFDELFSSLTRSLQSVADEYGWRNGQTLRLVFHVFKPLKNTEIDVVKQLVKQLDFNVLFAFVTISRKHPWILASSLRKTQRGIVVDHAKRGESFVIDKDSCLLQLCGSENRPNKRQGPPSPVLIRIHPNSTYKDLPYITQQIHDFSHLNWRSYYPCELPVTIAYSNWMANLIQRLEKLDGWNSSILDSHFRRKTWFL